MTTFRQIFHTAAGLTEYGRRLPAGERLAWRTLATQLQELADQEGGYALALDAPAEYAVQVGALHADLAGTDTPTAALAARWVARWLAEHDDQQTRRSRLQEIATARQLAPQPQSLVRTTGSLPAGDRRSRATGSRRDVWRPGMPLHRGWGVFQLGNVTVTTVVDHGCLVAILSAAELTCAADDRPWTYHEAAFDFQVQIGPPQTFGDPPAHQLAANLEHLARGLDHSSWRISTFASTSDRRQP